MSERCGPRAVGSGRTIRVQGGMVNLVDVDSPGFQFRHVSLLAPRWPPCGDAFVGLVRLVGARTLSGARGPVAGVTVTVSEERPDGADATQLIDELEATLAPHYPPDSRHGYSVEKLIAQRVWRFSWCEWTVSRRRLAACSSWATNTGSSNGCTCDPRFAAADWESSSSNTWRRIPAHTGCACCDWRGARSLREDRFSADRRVPAVR